MNRPRLVTRALAATVVLTLATVLAWPSSGQLGGGGCTPAGGERPVIAASLSPSEGTLVIIAHGEPGSVGLLCGQLRFLDPGDGGPLPFEIPFMFDANGTFITAVPLSGLAAIEHDYDLEFFVTTEKCEDTPNGTSGSWNLRMLRAPVSDPLTPPAGFGTIHFEPVVGTSAPLWPVFITAVDPPSPPPVTERCVFFCSVTGIEGVLPVH